MTVRTFTLGLMIAVAASGAPALAQLSEASAEQRLKAMLRCNAIADQTARVTCYDTAARATIAAGAVAAPVPAPQQSFGMDSAPAARKARQPRPEQLDRITARIVSRLDDGRGLWLFALDNGTTWQMTETTPFDPPRGGDSVVIRRGTLGGYAMLLGAGSMVRMRRLN